MLKNEMKTNINDIGFINYIVTETEKQKASSRKSEAHTPHKTQKDFENHKT